VQDRQIALGAWYTGPFSARPNDVVAFAAGTTHVNHRAADAAVKNSEYVFELDYTFVPTPGFLVRPNVQYIYSPGGSSTTKDVWVLGLKTVINF
jgi:porin